MVVQNAEGQMSECVHPAISKCINILVNQGILTIDEEQFCGMYPQIWENCSNSYYQIYNQYAEIVMTEEQKDQYRVARRKGRGKWRGGGFGLSGAVKGAATLFPGGFWLSLGWLWLSNQHRPRPASSCL